MKCPALIICNFEIADPKIMILSCEDIMCYNCMSESQLSGNPLQSLLFITITKNRSSQIVSEVPTQKICIYVFCYVFAIHNIVYLGFFSIRTSAHLSWISNVGNSNWLTLIYQPMHGFSWPAKASSASCH